MLVEAILGLNLMAHPELVGLWNLVLAGVKRAWSGQTGTWSEHAGAPDNQHSISKHFSKINF